MLSAPLSAFDRACGRWLAIVDRQARAVLAAGLLVTIAAGLYTALYLGTDGDTRNLINPKLPFQVRQREVTATFGTIADGFLVVIDADSPFAAGRAADALAERLARRGDLFSQVDVPGGGPFYARNALLYLEPEQLDDFADRLSMVQPFLAELSRDQSAAGIANLLRDALRASQRGNDVGIDLGAALDRVSAAVSAAADGQAAPDPWGSALIGASLPSEARQRVIALRPNLDFDSLESASAGIAEIRAAALELGLTPARGVRVRITGEPMLNEEQIIVIQKQATLVGVVSFFLFAATVSYALRSLRTVLALVTSLLFSLVWSNAFAALAVGHLNTISAVFNVLIIGLGGELGIHFCMRYAELIASGRGRTQALVETGQSIGSSLLSSASTTSIGFYIFLLTDFTGVAQMGFISGTGVLLSLVSTFTILPAVLAIGAPAPKVEAQEVPGWAARLEHLPLRWAGPIRIAALALGLGAVALLPRVRFDHNLLNLRDPNLESVQTFEELLSRPGTTPWTIDVIAPSLASGEELAARLRALPLVAEARTLRDHVPEDQEEKRRILGDAAYFVEPVRRRATPPEQAEVRAALLALQAEAEKAATSGGAQAAAAQRLARALARFNGPPGSDGPPPAAYALLQKNVVGSLPDQLADLTPLLAPEEVGLEDLPPAVVRQNLAADGRARVEVVPKEDMSDSAALQRFVDQVRTVAPEASGPAVWLVEWGTVTWTAMLYALLGGVACMAMVLIVLWRSVWDPLLAFFPLSLMAVVTCAVMVLAGQPFNFTNVIVLPMLLGMGIDNGVHLVHRHRTRPDEIDVLSSSTARAVFYSGVTTILSFGSLGFASHRGMAAIGQMLTLGVFLTLVAYVVVLPAILEWDDRRRRG